MAEVHPCLNGAGARSKDRSSRSSRGPGSTGPAHDPHLRALPPTAEEKVAAVGLESRDSDSGRHVEPIQDLSRSSIHAPDVALVPFPSAVPELAVDPGDPRHDALGFDRAKDSAGLGIDLMDLSVSIVTDPERSFGPREP